MESFTLFVVLPNEDICSLRNVVSGTSIRNVRKKLELTVGLPAQTYRLTSTKGQVLHEDHVLTLDLNVWDGYLLRAAFLDSWRELYDKVVEDDIQHVIQHGAVHMRKDVVWMDGAEEERAREVMRERGVVALFLASFLGMQDMCRALLNVGVDPNGRTPFGRTPLFAAMSRDNDHVMEQLLAHNAQLESRDVEGLSALDVARRAGAKECLRKVRHMKLQSAGESCPPSAAGSRASSQGQRRRLGPRVIRIPSGNVLERQSSFSSMSSDKAAGSTAMLTVSNARDKSPVLTSKSDTGSTAMLTVGNVRDKSPVLSSKSDTTVRDKEGKAVPVSKPSPVPPRTSSLPPPQVLFRHGERYSWENNLTHVARAPSAAGTHVRIPLHSQGGQRGPSARTASRAASRGPQPQSSSDTTSVASGTPRLLPFRPSVHDLSVKGPGSVMTTPSTSLATPSTTTVQEMGAKRDTGSAVGRNRRPGSALVKFCVNLPPPPTSQPFSPREVSPSQEPHGPAQEPPGRPPTRADTKTLPSSGFDSDSHHLPRHTTGFTGNDSIMGSQEALSIGSAPEFATGGVEGADRGGEAGPHPVNQGESDDDGGRVLSPRGKSSRTSGRFRSRLLVSRQKQQESWRTMRRRIKLAEEQKKTSKTKTKETEKEKAQKENFEKWLRRKRNEQQRHHTSSEEDTSEDDDDVMNRSAEDSQAFKDWLKDLKERPLRRPHSSTPASLHRRKTRPLKGLIQIDGNIEPVPEPDTDSYMTAYQLWQHRRNKADSRQQTEVDLREAKRRLEEKRKSMLAAALTYEDWLEHAEERKQLMQTILRADMEQLGELEQQIFRSRRAPRQISFKQWREKVEKKEAEIRQQRQRMRKEAELCQQNGFAGDGFLRSSAAIAHEEWVKRKKEEAVKNRSKSKASSGVDGKTNVSEDEKRAAWEAWLEQKHRHEVAQMDRHIRKERQLIVNLRQKKTPTVTQC